jgi:deoxyribonuclease-4
MPNLIIGSHVDCKSPNYLLDSVKQAVGNNANALMFYTGSPTSSVRVPTTSFKTVQAQELWERNGNDWNNLVIHAPYIINLAKDLSDSFPTDFLRVELERATSLGVSKVVLHPGSYTTLEKTIALNNIISRLDTVLKDFAVTILLESMALKGTEIGSLEDLYFIINSSVEKDKLGICLDTCHLWDAGYNINDFNAILDEIESNVGDKVKLLHINDSKNEQSSHKDRHENIGFGYIGFSTLINIIYNPRLENIPKILETPYVGIQQPYKLEIAMIKEKKYNNKLFEELK